MANKYIVVKVAGIILNISIKDEKIEGYSESVLSATLPDNPEIMTPKEQKTWIKANNIRMEAICKFMNENNL